MVPISSSKLNRKLASRALTKEGLPARKSIGCLFLGIIFGVFLAGILFYSLMNEDCRESSRNIMNIIGLKKHQNLNKNATLILETAEIKTEDKELSTIGTQETPDEFNTADNSSIVSSP
ncbi:uncharacterized protein LOC26535956 isoform X2 [Drosophila yakuba]|uniref:Uncharacterized protein n=1 Tax=Drosophila yakuba TaxID=7245 RepID=A0A0R1E1Q3_DROYA|nr:uncharacterized protein LOC26535956 isoform X2 [Drosophila yakuba]KRK02115.1 uncharacterized protein Dyak_GE29000 [Drosophila yakuba]